VICPGCGGTSFGAEFTSEGPRSKCNQCGNLFRFDDGQAVVSTVSREPPEQRELPRPQPVKQSKATTPIAGVNIVASARQRIRELSAEIKRLESLRKERDELQRLVKAAKTKPKGSAIVRPLRSNTG
jgi:hypothetical protein